MLCSCVSIWEAGTESSSQKDGLGAENLVGRCVGMIGEDDDLGRSPDKRPEKRKGLLTENSLSQGSSWDPAYGDDFLDPSVCRHALLYNTAIVLFLICTYVLDKNYVKDFRLRGDEV